MIKTFQLLYHPAVTWERIDKEQRSVAQIFVGFFLPWLLASTLFEGACLLAFGDAVGPMDNVVRIGFWTMLRYEVVTILLYLTLLFGGALLLSSMGTSFHSRSTFQGCFTTLAYSLSPMFVVRFFDGCPAISTWLCYAVGILLSISYVYRGLPRTLRPEPSNALGMYIFIAVFLIIATGLSHYIGTLIIQDKIFAGQPPSKVSAPSTNSP